MQLKSMLDFSHKKDMAIRIAKKNFTATGDITYVGQKDMHNSTSYYIFTKEHIATPEKAIRSFITVIFTAGNESDTLTKE